MIWGKYDAKVGFVPGGASLHSAMSAHGPDAPTVARAEAAALAPEKFDVGLAFMFESAATLRVTQEALDAPHLDKEYAACWAALKSRFDAAP